MMVKEYGPELKNVERYNALRKKGMSKVRAARIAGRPSASSPATKNNAHQVLVK